MGHYDSSYEHDEEMRRRESLQASPRPRHDFTAKPIDGRDVAVDLVQAISRATTGVVKTAEIPAAMDVLHIQMKKAVESVQGLSGRLFEAGVLSAPEPESKGSVEPAAASPMAAQLMSIQALAATIRDTLEDINRRLCV